MKRMNHGRFVLGSVLIAAIVAGTGCTRSKSEPVRLSEAKVREPVAQPAPVVNNYIYTSPPSQQWTSAFVGDQGTEGPAGPMGASGERGQTGSAGYAVAGGIGPAGPAGPMGARGPMGNQGPEGAVQKGVIGDRGPSGPSGPQGEYGATGERGASAAGFAGPAGIAGPQGTQGPQGPLGPRGEKIVGPEGRAGEGGAAGSRGGIGNSGLQGATTAGISGPSGPAGPSGAQGPGGPTGPQGITGVVERWDSYRDFWFDGSESAIHNGHAGKISEIAAYVKNNPTLELGIDGAAGLSGGNSSKKSLCDRRSNAVRNALIAQGVEAGRVSIGDMGNPSTRREGRVEVLLRTRKASR